MNPDRYIEDLCHRHGVSRKFGKRLQPLVERAQDAPFEKRARILDLVTRSFEYEARRVAEQPPRPPVVQFLSPGEKKNLFTVASLLHQWTPPGWLEQWGKGKQAG
jgi:hypothetical protein